MFNNTKKDEKLPKRPSSYNMYQKKEYKRLKDAGLCTNFSEGQKLISTSWKALTKKEKDEYIYIPPVAESIDDDKKIREQVEIKDEKKEKKERSELEKQETKIKKKKVVPEKIKKVVVPEKVKKVVVPKIILKKEKIKRSGLDYKKSNNESKEIVLETKEIVDDYDDDSSSVSSLSSVSYASSLSSVSSCSDSTDDDDDDILENKTMNNYNDDSDSSNNSKSSDISNKCSSNCKTDKEDFSEPIIFRPKSRFF
jgi:hypothetical protein